MKFRFALCLALVPFAVACSGKSTADVGDPAATDSDNAALASSTPSEPSNFVKVRDGLYRGGHPGKAQLQYLKSLGIHRVLDLEVDDLVEAQPGEIAAEELHAYELGIKLVREPMSAFEPAVGDEFDQRIDRIVALLKTATAADPIYVHCKHGQDRTGLVIGIERVEDEGWKAKDAYDEMVERGFHKMFLGLDGYFERRTGYSPER